jgi:hypothetical protein
MRGITDSAAEKTGPLAVAAPAIEKRILVIRARRVMLVRDAVVDALPEWSYHRMGTGSRKES